MGDDSRSSRRDVKGFWRPSSVTWNTVRTLRPNLQVAEAAVVSGPPWAPTCLDPLVIPKTSDEDRHEEETQWQASSRKRSADAVPEDDRDLSVGPVELETPDLFQLGRGQWHFKRGGTKEQPISFCAPLALTEELRYLASTRRYPRATTWCKKCVTALPSDVLSGVRLWQQHAAQCQAQCPE